MCEGGGVLSVPIIEVDLSLLRLRWYNRLFKTGDEQPLVKQEREQAIEIVHLAKHRLHAADDPRGAASEDFLGNDDLLDDPVVLASCIRNTLVGRDVLREGLVLRADEPQLDRLIICLHARSPEGPMTELDVLNQEMKDRQLPFPFSANPV